MVQPAARMGDLGTETAFDVLSRAAALRDQGRDIINLGIGSPDFRTPDHIVAAGQQALADGYHFYTPAKGLAELRLAVAADLQRRYGADVDPDHVMVVPGGKPTMFFAIHMFGEPGAEILYPDPGFPIYRSLIDFVGATAVPVPLREEHRFGLRADDVLSRVTSSTRMIIINSPGNPTGGVAAEQQIEQLVEGLRRHPDVVILSDEIYSHITYGTRHVSLLSYPEVRDRLILLDGWSKTYSMTGWRLGYGVWPPEFIDLAERLQINSNSCATAAVQVAGIAALAGPQDGVDTMVATFEERRRLIVNGLNTLPGVRCPMPDGAFYAFPNIEGTGLGTQDFQDRLLEEVGVATVAGTSFGEQGTGHVRFSYAAATDRLEEALERLAGFLGGV